MSVKLNENYLKGFISEAEISNMQPTITTAHNLLRTKQGPGNDFLVGCLFLLITIKKSLQESKKLQKKSETTAKFLL